MTVDLFRVDDRLVHGQVTAGWGRVLEPGRIVIIDDETAGSGWEKDLYESAVPPDTAFEVWSVEEAVTGLPACREDDVTTFVLVRDLDTLTRLVERGCPVGEVNLGGIHYEEGRRELLPYLYLDSDDRARLLWLREQGVAVTARDLPTSNPVDVFELIDGERGEA